MSDDEGNGRLVIDGTDYSQPRHLLHPKPGDEPPISAEAADLNAIWLEIVTYLEQTKKMNKTGVNRWTFDGRSGAFDPNIEVGVVHGELRVRVYQEGKQIGTVDIRGVRHTVAAKKRIHGYLQQAQGFKWVKGKGWVAG